MTQNSELTAQNYNEDNSAALVYKIPTVENTIPHS